MRLLAGMLAVMFAGGCAFEGEIEDEDELEDGYDDETEEPDLETAETISNGRCWVTAQPIAWTSYGYVGIARAECAPGYSIGFSVTTESRRPVSTATWSQCAGMQSGIHSGGTRYYKGGACGISNGYCYRTRVSALGWTEWGPVFCR